MLTRQELQYFKNFFLFWTLILQNGQQFYKVHEQSHRGIKQRYYPMMGFGSLESARRFCQVFDEVKNFFRPQLVFEEFMSLSKRRKLFLERVKLLRNILKGA